jgi:hypothetical protein
MEVITKESEDLQESNVDENLAETGDQEEAFESVGKFERTVDYMETEKGHEVTLRFVAVLEQLSPVIKTLLEAKVEGLRIRPTYEFRKWTLLMIVRLVVFIVAVGALIYMRRSGSIDPAIALLIGGLVAYFFGYNRSQS